MAFMARPASAKQKMENTVIEKAFLFIMGNE